MSIKRLLSSFFSPPPSSSATTLTEISFKTSSDLVVLCLGLSGKRIWSHLILNRTGHALFPVVPTSKTMASEVIKLLGSKSQLVIATALNEPMFGPFLLDAESRGDNSLKSVKSVLVYPRLQGASSSSRDVAELNLKRSKSLFQEIKVVHQIKKTDSLMMDHPSLVWLPKQISPSEKQAVLEILMLAELESRKQTARV